MICVVLAAGYATRLYPLTKNFPKPLLEVRGKCILDWLVDDLESTGVIQRYVVVSNHRYAPHFQRWAAEKSLRIDILDDGSTSNESRLGAVKDIQFAINQIGVKEDMLVIAGDNLLDFSLRHFTDYASAHDAPCVMRFWEADERKLSRAGVAEVDDVGRILHMEEKPAHPKAHWCTPPFYYYPGAAIHFVADAIEAGCATDAPGSLIAWLCEKTTVYSMEMPGQRYDIGNLESYRAVQESYLGIAAETGAKDRKR